MRLTPIFACALAASLSAAERPISVTAQFEHGPQRPSSVPILPGLNVGRNPFGKLVGKPLGKAPYEPVEGDSFHRHNGPSAYNYVLTSGVWWLAAGDQPKLSLALRSSGSAYATPALLPGLGISGKLRIEVSSHGRTKWLDQFDSIDSVFAPGSVRWTCHDTGLGITVRLEALPFTSVFGFAVSAEIRADHDSDVALSWVLDEMGREQKARVLRGNLAELTTADLPYTLALAGAESQPSVEHPTQALRFLERRSIHSGQAATSRFICVWGYRGYDEQAVADAYQRLEFLPFADAAWLAQMKKAWFEHWIGKGLDPEKKFLQVREAPGRFIAEAQDFWVRQRNRLRVKTPDAKFDTIVNSTSAMAYELYEYPAFIHGLNYAKYGKINHGYYGLEAAGLHPEVADSLLFLTGTQDVKGRQRYFTPAFAISNWHEDMDFYFVEQVWYHWRWTGDRDFIRIMWPAVKRALEHGLETADPDGDGIMTGYYEMWNSDQNNTGGFSVLETAMAWAALRAAAEMAAELNDRDFHQQMFVVAYNPVFAERYGMLAALTEHQFARHFWQKDVGAWASAEVNGINRPRPHTCEQNYHIWRGLGDPLRNYCAMRYIRDNLQRADIEPGNTYEFVNDWWPIQWSHHYVATGDTFASVHSAAIAGDIDHFWPAFETAWGSAYQQSGTMWHHTGARSMELEPLFLQAVVDGLFGVQPWFNKNLLVLRPNLPSHWNRAEFAHSDVNYTYSRDGNTIRMQVRTPVKRTVRCEIPVRSAVLSVHVDGHVAPYHMDTGVNAARVIVESAVRETTIFEIRLQPEEPTVTGTLRVLVGRSSKFILSGATLLAVHDPQLKLTSHLEKNGEVSLVPASTGKFTIFLELRKGTSRWYWPLDLEAVSPWRVVQRYNPGLTETGPSLASPMVDSVRRSLSLEIENSGTAGIAGRAKVTVGTVSVEREVSIPVSGIQRLDIPLEASWSQLSPGSVPVIVELADQSESVLAINWSAGEQAAVRSRMMPLPIAPYMNADMSGLFSPATEWRIDYTGSQHGVDRRHPMPLRDQYGFVILNSVMSVFDYGTLPEQWRPEKRWELPDLAADLSPAGVPFVTAPHRILAISATEPYAQFPSAVRLRLDEPRRLQKLYLLTANITKTLKSYYPGGEVIIHYEGGTDQLHQMIPPYTMPGAIGNICPRAFAVPFGRLIGGGNPVLDKNGYLSMVDVVLDPSRRVESIELRAVATETLLGIVGATVLKAP